MTSPSLEWIGVVVVRHAGKVLIGKRPAGTPLAGFWEFPGGKVAQGETVAQAAARECQEETGVAVRVGEPLLEVVHPYPHGRVRLHFFHAEPVDPTQVPREPFRWVDLNELSAYRFPPANAAVIDKLTRPGAAATPGTDV